MLKGTEKQVAWAEDIIRVARETVNSNIQTIKEQQEKYNAEFRKNELDGYTACGKSLEAMLSKVEDASQIISMREKLSSRSINEMVNEYVRMVQIRKHNK